MRARLENHIVAFAVTATTRHHSGNSIPGVLPQKDLSLIAHKLLQDFGRIIAPEHRTMHEKLIAVILIPPSVTIIL